MYFPYTERIKEIEDLVFYYHTQEVADEAINQAPDTFGSFDANPNGVTRGQKGLIGNSYSFDGINDFIDLGNNVSSDAIKAGFPQTIFFHIFASSAPSVNAPIILTGDWNATNYSGFAVQFLTNGKITMEAGAGGGAGSPNRKSFTPTNTLKLGKWNPVVCVFENITNFNLYISKTLFTGSYTGTGNGVVYDTNTSKIGKASNTSRVAFLPARLQHMGIINRIVTEDEIELISDFAPPFPTHFRT